MNIYCISGLGADRRAFQRIRFPAQFAVHFIEWEQPPAASSVLAYAQSLARHIDQQKPFALVGLSFGGMIAATLATVLRPELTILISSASNRQELPWYYRMAAATRVHRLLPHAMFRSGNPLVYLLFGTRKQAERRILKEIMDANDPAFLKWAITALLEWKLDYKPDGVFHIHGDKDYVLPLRYTNADAVIKGGTHFMIWTKAGKVQKIIWEKLNGLRHSQL